MRFSMTAKQQPKNGIEGIVTLQFVIITQFVINYKLR